MNKLIVFPQGDKEIHTCDEADDSQHIELAAIANSLTIILIQQALDDALITKDWRDAKKKIKIAIKRGHIHSVK